MCVNTIIIVYVPLVHSIRALKIFCTREETTVGIRDGREVDRQEPAVGKMYRHTKGDCV